MIDNDLKYRLIGGRPVFAEGYGNITPLTMDEVIDYGYTKYMECLNVVNLEKKDFFNENDEGYQELMDIDILDILISLGGDELVEKLTESLSLFLRGEAILDKENLLYIIKISEEEYLQVDRTNYHSITEVLKWQNYINHFTDKKEDKFNPANEKAIALKKRMEELKRKTDELKRKQNDDGEEGDTDLYDILSAISSKSNSINEINIMNLTIYQVYTKFKRLEIIDQYNISIKSILAGAQDINLKHWSVKAD